MHAFASFPCFSQRHQQVRVAGAMERGVCESAGHHWVPTLSWAGLKCDSNLLDTSCVFCSKYFFTMHLLPIFFFVAPSVKEFDPKIMQPNVPTNHGCRSKFGGLGVEHVVKCGVTTPSATPLVYLKRLSFKDIWTPGCIR